MPRDDSVLPAAYRLSHYRVRRVLGRGGFGVTYLAADEHDGGQVAVKEYFPVECAVRQDDQRVVASLGDDHEDTFRWGLERFRDEGRVLARFSHPNIVRVIGDFEAHGTHYIVMAYVDGETLSTRLTREGPLDEKRSLALVLPIVDGLEQVHAAGYLHRDIKPSNIVIGADGAPVLLDFGAARRALGDRTRSLTAVVSDGYAPLEQYARDSRQGPWTDIYALGAVLYRCLTNRPVPEAPARASGDELVPATEASPYRLSPGLSDALDAALAVRAADRPPTLAVWRQMFGRSRHGVVQRPMAAARDDGTPPDSDGTVAGAAPAGTAALSSQRQRLADWVRRQLIGPAGTGRLLGSPVERYPTGVLHPVDPGGSGMTGLDPARSGKNQESSHLDPAGPPVDSQAAVLPGAVTAPPDDEEDDSPVAADGTPGSVTARPVGRRRYVPPSSVGVSFFVRGDARLRVTASAASYQRVRERGESGRFVAHPPDDGDGRSLDDTGNVAGARYARTPFECGLVWPEADSESPVEMRREVQRRPYRDGDALSATFSDLPPARSIHSMHAMDGRRGIALVSACSAASRASSRATRSSPRAGSPSAVATARISLHTSPSPNGSSNTMTGCELTRSHTACSTSFRLTAHTSHCVCVTMTVGARRFNRSGSTRYTDNPSPTIRRTWRSIAALEACSFTFDVEQTGSRATLAG